MMLMLVADGETLDPRPHRVAGASNSRPTVCHGQVLGTLHASALVGLKILSAYRLGSLSKKVDGANLRAEA